MILVGVDAGSTKTKAVAYSCDGSFVGEGLSGPGNPHDLGLTEAKRNVVDAVMKATKGVKPDYVVIGFAGMDTAEDEIAFSQFFADVGKRTESVHDSVIALFSETFGGPGIVVIAGTGSVVVGYDGKSFRRIGGRGWLLSDEGSAYWVSVNALRWMQRVFDGLEHGGELFDFMRSKMGVATHDDLVKWAYENQCKKDKVASLAALLSEAADRGISKAEDFLREGAIVLADRVKVMMARINVDLVVTKGSMFKSRAFYNAFREDVLAAGGKVIPDRNPPEVGALYLAAKRAGCDKLIERLAGRR
ncbi:MAG: BadF/BadG/BcrA/BcrD ATPase family protein [Thermoprotei archaeon]